MKLSLHTVPSLTLAVRALTVKPLHTCAYTTCMISFLMVHPDQPRAIGTVPVYQVLVLHGAILHEQMMKMMCVLVLQEGVCILSGLGYNGVVDGKHQWDACANMKVWLFETTPLFGGTISSFNINTNAWAARSVLSLKSVTSSSLYTK